MQGVDSTAENLRVHSIAVIVMCREGSAQYAAAWDEYRRAEFPVKISVDVQEVSLTICVEAEKSLIEGLKKLDVHAMRKATNKLHATIGEVRQYAYYILNQLSRASREAYNWKPVQSRKISELQIASKYDTSDVSSYEDFEDWPESPVSEPSFGVIFVMARKATGVAAVVQCINLYGTPIDW